MTDINKTIFLEKSCWSYSVQSWWTASILETYEERCDCIMYLGERGQSLFGALFFRFLRTFQVLWTCVGQDLACNLDEKQPAIFRRKKTKDLGLVWNVVSDDCHTILHLVSSSILTTLSGISPTDVVSIQNLFEKKKEEAQSRKSFWKRLFS